MNQRKSDKDGDVSEKHDQSKLGWKGTGTLVMDSPRSWLICLCEYFADLHFPFFA